MLDICTKCLPVLQYGLPKVKLTRAKLLSRFKSVLFVAIACLIATQPTAASQVTYFPATEFEPAWALYDFDFTAFPLGTATGFAETVGSFTITYTAPNDPFAFRTVDSGDIPASSSPPQWLLGQTGSSVLELSFNHRVFGVGVEFLVFGDTPISMSLLREGSVVDPIAGPPFVQGGIPPGLIYPEGFISALPACLCANYFDAVRLFDPSDSGFAVHRIVVAQLGVPEPPMPAILGIGLAVLVALRRRKLH